MPNLIALFFLNNIERIINVFLKIFFINFIIDKTQNKINSINFLWEVSSINFLYEYFYLVYKI